MCALMISEEDLDEVLQTDDYSAQGPTEALSGIDSDMPSMTIPSVKWTWLLHKAMRGRGNPVQKDEPARDRV